MPQVAELLPVKYLNRKKNARRFELINKEMNSALTAEEAKELAGLQEWCDKWLDKHYPLPELPEIGGGE